MLALQQEIIHRKSLLADTYTQFWHILPTSTAVVSFDQNTVDTNGVLREPESVGTTNIVLMLSKPVDQDASITIRNTAISATGEI